MPMTHRIVEISKSGYYLHKHRGFLEVQEGDISRGKIPLDEINTVIFSSPGSSISTALIAVLMDHNIPLVICGTNYMPSNMTLPLSGNIRQFQTMQAQINLSAARRKQAWRKIIQQKILNQAALLDYYNQPTSRLRYLAKQVRSGDPDNFEAQAARIYWQSLLGKEFRRDRTQGGTNAALNYAYTILRACVARGMVGAGLHPSFSLKHINPQNPFNLVDDLMEPFRPIADAMVMRLPDNFCELTPALKTYLASLTILPLPYHKESLSLSHSCVRQSQSFSRYIMGESDSLLLPNLPLPINFPHLPA